jgi:transposase, IS30 family
MGRGSGPAFRLSSSDRLEIQRLVRTGERYVDAAGVVGCSAKSVQRLLIKTGGLKPRNLPRSMLRLSVEEREEISRGLTSGTSCQVIAFRLNRSTSTVSRDVAANGGRQRYRAWRADERALRKAHRPKPSKLSSLPRLRREVERGLARRWSPQQIAARLRVAFPDDLEMRVSHETIYQSLFVQGRGALRKELTQCLRTGRAQRRPSGRAVGPGELKNMVLLSERPAEADDRAVPGHWEGDLIVGKRSQSAIATLVERQTRFVMLCRLDGSRLAEHVKEALAKKILELPEHLRRSLTWDRGKEMGEHVRFTLDTGVQVYFCDPRSPWQRATNENSNGLLRQYFPKGTDLAGHTQKHLDRIATELNGRPRQTLDWRTPSEAFARVVAMTA